MIDLCVFDMGGVIVRDFHVMEALLEHLGHQETHFRQLSDDLGVALKMHGKGEISEQAFWDLYERVVPHAAVVTREESLFGMFFQPTLDEPTIAVIQRLKEQGMRVVCGTNVIDAHFLIHHQLHQYDIFDHVYASHLIHQSKPDSEFYHHIALAERVAPERIFFTDDMEENVQAARAQGWDAHLYIDATTLEAQLESLGIPLTRARG